MKKNLLLAGLTTMLFAQIGFSQKHDFKGVEHLKKKNHLKSGNPDKNGYQQKALVFRPSKSKNFNFDINNSEWVHVDSTYYTYDDQGYLLSELIRANGLDQSMQVFEYNDAHQTTMKLYKNYSADAEALVNNYRYTYAFDENGLEIENNYEVYDNELNTWQFMSGSRNINTYNEANQVVEIIYQTIYSGMTEYTNRERYTNTYTDGKLTDHKWFRWNNDQADWDPYSWTENHFEDDLIVGQTFYYWHNDQYNTEEKYVDITWHRFNGNPDSSLYSQLTYMYFDGLDWNPYSKYSRTYYENDGFDELSLNFSDGEYRNYYRSSHRYDSEGNLILESYDYYSDSSWHRDYYQQLDYIYDESDHRIQTILSIYNWYVNEIVYDHRKDYSDFNSFHNSVEMETLTIDATIYPNPVNDVLVIQLDNTEISSIIIKDINGKIVSNVNGQGTRAQLNVQHLNTGMYFIEINSGSNTAVKRFSKI